MEVKSLDKNITFLAGGGEMGKLTREKDWSNTSLGLPQTWPQSLRTTLSIILHSKFPMFLFWGDELTCFYNDAYRPSLGKDGKHPFILGMKGEEAWPEIWHIIKPLIDQVLTQGEATWSEDQLIPIYRNGKIEDVYWTFSYSPVNDESGKPSGVFVTCTESTEKINLLKQLEGSNDELAFAIEATGLGTWDYDPATNKLSANE
ncbi:MAG TPA: PAS domain-containing protein, partial [Ferruginibacter sp.]|nr:PAS domain-containing protein [Ferruginibacter sp.]